MAAKVLVAYATQYGSTEEVAESIAVSLENEGVEAEYAEMNKVTSLDGFDAVVFGSPIYIGQWLDDAHTFLTKFQARLEKLPVAVFGLGPVSNDEKEMANTLTQLDDNLGKYPWLKPGAVQMFVGSYDPRKLKFDHQKMAAVPGHRAYGKSVVDNRDWGAISDWAAGLPAQLGLK